MLLAPPLAVAAVPEEPASGAAPEPVPDPEPVPVAPAAASVPVADAPLEVTEAANTNS